MEWISVKNRLPDHNEIVAYVWDGNDIKNGVFICLNNKRFIEMKMDWEVEVEGVTHWIPKPKPPIDSDFRPHNSIAQESRERYEENLMRSKHIQRIEPPRSPFNFDEKIMFSVDEDGEIIGEPISINEFDQYIEDIAGLDD